MRNNFLRSAEFLLSTHERIRALENSFYQNRKDWYEKEGDSAGPLYCCCAE